MVVTFNIIIMGCIMPIKIPDNLPAKEVLEKEHIFVMDERMAFSQDIRPLRILILNLMPTKIVTETQILRLLSNSPLQTEVSFIHPASHKSKNTSPEHLETFYRTFDEIKHNKYDGLIITGAPVEMISFEEVNYWNELCSIMAWSNSNVTTTLHICWAAQAGVYYHYGIDKYPLKEKLSGVYKHSPHRKSSRILRGFDDIFYVPHSRYTEIRIEDVEKESDLDILASSQEAGLCLCASKDRRQIFMTGHLEYDRDTLKLEYLRDLEKGLKPSIPENYFPDNDPNKKPYHHWKSHAYLMYANWLNYYVYQATPYNLDDISSDFIPERKGESE